MRAGTIDHSFCSRERQISLRLERNASSRSLLNCTGLSRSNAPVPWKLSRFTGASLASATFSSPAPDFSPPFSPPLSPCSSRCGSGFFASPFDATGLRSPPAIVPSISIR